MPASGGSSPEPESRRPARAASITSRSTRRGRCCSTFEAARFERVVHVSTGATGNTPLGTWRVYRKVTGFDWVLWYPMYFLRGFAIHGYPSVPAYPASHGCVRVPMWIAPQLFAGHPHGATVTIYL